MSNFEQLLNKILDCVTESVVTEDIENKPNVVDNITESVINGDISVDECKLLLESVENTEYYISVLERFEEGIIDNDECIVLLEATRYEKEHTKALEELRKTNEELEKKIKALEELKKTSPNNSKTIIDKRIQKLKNDFDVKVKKYKLNYSKGDDYRNPLDNKTRLEYANKHKKYGTSIDEDDISDGRGLKRREQHKDFNVPSKAIREPGLYLKAQQGK